MDIFKIENYERLHGKGSFIPLKRLSEENGVLICQSIREKFDVNPSASSVEMIKTIRKQCKLLEDFNAEQANFQLHKVLDFIKVKCQENVYLNWRHFDDIDEVNSTDLFEFFSDIWYPSSDDLDIFDGTFNWLVSIEDNGAIRFWKSITT